MSTNKWVGDCWNHCIMNVFILNYSIEESKTHQKCYCHTISNITN